MVTIFEKKISGETADRPKKLAKRLADTLAIVHATMLEKQRTGGELIQAFVTY